MTKVPWENIIIKQKFIMVGFLDSKKVKLLSMNLLRMPILVV